MRAKRIDNDMYTHYYIVPVPKPRMTKRDKWLKRPCVVKYFNFKAEVKSLGIELPEHGAHIMFRIPMPKSWSRAKKERMIGEAHRSRPDLDNLLKGLMDAIFEEDSYIHDVRVTKLWWDVGGIDIGGISYE